MRSNLASLHVRNHMSKDDDYDLIDEIYIRFNIREEMFISGIIEGGMNDLIEAKNNVKELLETHTYPSGVHYDGLNKTDYSFELEYIEHVEEINKRYESL